MSTVCKWRWMWQRREVCNLKFFLIWIRPRQESQCISRLWKYLFEIKIVKNRDKNRNTQCSPDSLEAEEEHPGYILIFSMVQQSIHVYLTPYNFFKGTHLNVEGEGSPSTFKFWFCDQVSVTWDERGSLPRAGWPPGEGPCWWSSLLSSAPSWLFIIILFIVIILTISKDLSVLHRLMGWWWCSDDVFVVELEYWCQRCWH